MLSRRFVRWSRLLLALPMTAPHGHSCRRTDATQAEIDAGNNVIATIPIDPATAVPTGDFIARWTNAEYLHCKCDARPTTARWPRIGTTSPAMAPST